MTRLLLDPRQFATDFDQRPFYLRHTLEHHPLFELSALAALADRLPEYLVESEYGEPAQPRTRARDEIVTVAEKPTWVLLRQIEHDQTYKALLDELLDEIQTHSERIRPGMQRRESFLFVSSRQSITPFHFDPEYNFLLQLRGQKTVYMWDPDDRFVVPAAAIDEYYAARRTNRNQPFRDEFFERAWVRPLAAGEGLHFPLHAPHVVKTESDISVSLSITFRAHESRRRAAVHTSNGHLRRLGIEPPWPRRSRIWDSAAHLGYWAHHGVHQLDRLAARLRQRVRDGFARPERR